MEYTQNTQGKANLSYLGLLSFRGNIHVSIWFLYLVIASLKVRFKNKSQIFKYVKYT